MIAALQLFDFDPAGPFINLSMLVGSLSHCCRPNCPTCSSLAIGPVWSFHPLTTLINVWLRSRGNRQGRRMGLLWRVGCSRHSHIRQRPPPRLSSNIPKERWPSVIRHGGHNEVRESGYNQPLDVTNSWWCGERLIDLQGPSIGCVPSLEDAVIPIFISSFVHLRTLSVLRYDEGHRAL
jgi:hypothetical protein